MARFDELIEETKNEIRVLLRNPDIRPSYMTYDQLRDVQSEICRMARIRDPEKFFPYFPKGIADDTCSAYIKQEKRMDDLPGHGDTGWCFFRVHGLQDDDQFTPGPR